MTLRPGSPVVLRVLFSCSRCGRAANPRSRLVALQVLRGVFLPSAVSEARGFSFKKPFQPRDAECFCVWCTRLTCRVVSRVNVSCVAVVATVMGTRIERDLHTAMAKAE